MAQVDSQIDLIWLGDFYLSLFILHEDGDELIADLGSVLCVVVEAEGLGLHVLLEVGVLLQLDLVGLLLLHPPNLIKALPKQNHVRQHRLKKTIVHLLRQSVQVQRKDLIQ